MTLGSGIDARLRGVVHLYPSAEGDVVALRGVDLDVSAGEVVSILGPSGSGKSTVLGLLAGNFVASAGSVAVGGADIGRMDARALTHMRATQVSLVVQGAERNLLPYASAADNVWFAQRGAAGPRRRSGEQMPEPEALLDRFGLGEVAAIPTWRLSAGVRQRVALACGVAPRPPLLLVDEPTSRLDPASRDQVVEMLLGVGAELGSTVVVVTHDPEVAARMGRTVTIRDGRVGAEGRRGRDYAVVGHDGLVQLPQEVLDLLPPDSLVEVDRRLDGVLLRRASLGEDRPHGEAP